MNTGCGDYDLLRRRVEEMIRRLGREPAAPGFGTTLWSPATDVFETETGAVVKMELPGVRAEHLSIVLVDDRLLIRGRREDPDAGRKVRYHQMEIAYGPFAKLLYLHVPFDREGIRATLKDGFLVLVIPRAKQRRPERIAVEIRL